MTLISVLKSQQHNDKYDKNLSLVVGGRCVRLCLRDHCQHGQLTFLTSHDLVQFHQQQLDGSIDLVLTVENHLQLTLFRLLKLTTPPTDRHTRLTASVSTTTWVRLSSE